MYHVHAQNSYPTTEADNAKNLIIEKGLDWQVQKLPLYTGVDRQVRIKNRFAICRMDQLDQTDGGQLGIVGRDYEPLQNREAFSFMDPLVQKGAATFESVGCLNGGRQLWLLARLPGVIQITGEDITNKYLLLSNSHDGSSAVRIGLTPIRVVCKNTLNLAIDQMEGSGLIMRHSRDVAIRVKAAYKMLGLVNKTYHQIGEQFQQMARIPMTGNRMADYFENLLLPVADEEKDGLNRQTRHRWAELFETGDGNQLPGVRGSLWAVYNAVTQWVDRESYTPRLKEPLKRIWFGEGARLKEQAFDQAVRRLIKSN